MNSIITLTLIHFSVYCNHSVNRRGGKGRRGEGRGGERGREEYVCRGEKEEAGERMMGNGKEK